MKYQKIIVVALFIIAFYVLHVFFLRQGHINNIYQQSVYSENWKRDCKSTVVLVNDAPLSRYAQKKLWVRYGDRILEKYRPLTHVCDDILFLENKTERADDVGDNHYWIGDNQYCLNGILGGEKCISKENQLFTVRMRGWSEDEKIGMVDRTAIYIHFIDYGKSLPNH